MSDSYIFVKRFGFEYIKLQKNAIKIEALIKILITLFVDYAFI